MATLVYEFHLMLYTRYLTWDNSGHATLAASPITMTALVVLAGRLPGYAHLGGDLRPPNAQVHGLVDQCCEFRIDLQLRGPGALDLVEHLGGSRRNIPQGQPRWLRRCPPRRARLRPLGSRSRLALTPSHAIEHAGQLRHSW